MEIMIKTIIEELHKTNKSTHIDFLSKNITEAINDLTFYTLPFDIFRLVIQRTNFSPTNSNQEPIELIKTLIKCACNFYKENSILLLNDIKFHTLSRLSFEDTLEIISQFKFSDILCQIKHLYVIHGAKLE